MMDLIPPNNPYANGGKVTISLTGTRETLMGPLIARARDANMPNSVLNDIYAVQVLDQIDHDIEKFKINDEQATMHTLRVLRLDRWTLEFLANNPEATVLHLACGLDSRWHRLQTDLTNVRWIDVDYPEVVELRSRLIPCPTGDYNLIAADVTEDAWLDQIPADRPTVVICQGLLMYLEEEAGKHLIRRLVKHFKTGQLILDFVGTMMVPLQGSVGNLTGTGASLSWCLDEPKILETLHPQLEMLECLGLSELGDYSRMPAGTRLMLSTYSHLPWFRHVSSYVRFKF